MNSQISPRQIAALEALIRNMESPGFKRTPAQRQMILEDAKAAVAVLRGASR